MSADARFEALYRSHAGRVRAYALRRTSAAAADDVVADVFLVAWRRLDVVPDPALPWLLGVARRILANRRRGAGRAAALHARLVRTESPDPDQAGGSHGLPALDGDERVLHALGAVSGADRELLMLVAWEGLALGEIADVLGVRANTVSVRLHRARQRFASALAAQDAAPTHKLEARR